MWIKGIVILCTLAFSHALIPPTEEPDAFTLQPPYLYEGGARCSVDIGCLTLTNSSSVSGTDGIGQYVGIFNTHSTPLGTRMTTLAKVYDDLDVTVYETSFPDGLEGCSMGDRNGVCTGYPVFNLVNAASNTVFRYVTPGDSMTGWNLYSQGSFWSSYRQFRSGEMGGIAGFIIPDSYSVVMSALQHPMAVNNWLDVNGTSASLHYGVQGLADSIPAGYSISVIAVTGRRESSTSFVSTVLKWGQSVQMKNDVVKIPDYTTEYLGYWTDNGAYYYYNNDHFEDYEKLITSLNHFTITQQIPIRYIQLDSWWYYKGVDNGVKNWTARPDIFPHGIAPVHNATGWPILAHNRYFSSDNVYASQNGGNYPFFIDEENKKAVPLDKHFWDDLFDEARQWGLSVYEQDWLDREYEGVSALHTNITLGDDWLHNMASSAAQRNIAVQYCMSLPREALHGAAEEAVTQIRVSDDYHLATNQWRIGHTSLFAHALGLKPYKDVFWTTELNNNNPFTWCQVFQPTLQGITTNYVGHINVTESGVPCVYWDSIDFRAQYPTYSLPENFCRNPGMLHDRAFCFTNASLDYPEELWTWEYCDVPTCETDCYVREGRYYIGNQSVTENGHNCVDWNGYFGLTGARCRNPDGTEDRPWCFITEDYTAIDFCDNKCPEAEEYSPDLQSAVATLSAGPVGIGDKMENINRSLVFKSCRSDGKLLQPGKPLTAIDMYFLSDSRPNIWTSETTISSKYTFGLIFIAEVSQRYSLSASELNLEKSLSGTTLLWYNYPYIDQLTIYPSNTDIETPKTGGFRNFVILATSPIFEINGDTYAILGEVDKWAHVSSTRITDITIEEQAFLVRIDKYSDESVYMRFYKNGFIFEIACSLNNNLIDVIARTCS